VGGLAALRRGHRVLLEEPGLCEDFLDEVPVAVLAGPLVAEKGDRLRPAEGSQRQEGLRPLWAVLELGEEGVGELLPTQPALLVVGEEVLARREGLEP